HRGWKIRMLVFHHEPKNASPNAAAKAVKRLSLRADMEGWRFFLMKGTERFEIRAGPFQRKIRADHLHDVVGGGHLLDCFRRNHLGFYFSLVCFLKRCQNLPDA